MWQRLPRIAWFYVGLTFMALGHALIIKPALGPAPWDILHISLRDLSGMSLSMVMQVIGFVIIGVNWALGIKPTLGMALNMLSFGPIMDLWLNVLPLPESSIVRWAMLLAGILIVGQGTALYVSAGLGSGPRDGMMLGLNTKTGVSVGLIKNIIDVAVTFAGWLLGGPLGVGTVVVAASLGPSVQLGVNMVGWLAAKPGWSRFVTPVGKPAVVKQKPSLAD
jgi:uncharacterized protein